MEQKTCNHCLQKQMVEKREEVQVGTTLRSGNVYTTRGTGYYSCMNPECPHFALLQIPIEDLPTVAKD